MSRGEISKILWTSPLGRYLSIDTLTEYYLLNFLCENKRSHLFKVERMNNTQAINLGL